VEGLVNGASAAQNAIISVVSSMSDQASLGDRTNNSYFTRALIEALQGAAARPGVNEVLTVDLHGYLYRRVYFDLSDRRQTVWVNHPVSPIRLTVLRR